jgi:hypothetical protein
MERVWQPSGRALLLTGLTVTLTGRGRSNPARRRCCSCPSIRAIMILRASGCSRRPSGSPLVITGSPWLRSGSRLPSSMRRRVEGSPGLPRQGLKGIKGDTKDDVSAVAFAMARHAATCTRRRGRCITTTKPATTQPPPRLTPARPRTQGTRRHKLKSTPIMDPHPPLHRRCLARTITPPTVTGLR